MNKRVKKIIDLPDQLTFRLSVYQCLQCSYKPLYTAVNVLHSPIYSC